MNLCNNGKLLCSLRKAKGMTQKQVADGLGVQPKTVSKWETGHGFPDTSLLADLAELLGVSVDTLLSGALAHNATEVGNMTRTSFYVCPHCGSFMQGNGKMKLSCCGKTLMPLTASTEGGEHTLTVGNVENDYYITFDHEMSKEHYISFVAYVACDRVLTVKLYPEQDSSVRFPRLYGGKLYYFCSRHGLFEYDPAGDQPKTAGKASLTALMSAFSRAYVSDNCGDPVFRDEFAGKLFSPQEYRRIESLIAEGGRNVRDYVLSELAPTPLARSRFCEESLAAAVLTGTVQYVVLGCGYDMTGFGSGSRIFAIDRESVIRDRLERIHRAGLEVPGNVTYIPAELPHDSLRGVLEANGFDCGRKTFFSCLGLMYYLTPEEVSALFGEISGFAAPGSTVVFDFADSHLFSSEVPRVKNMLDMAEKSGEPMKSCFGYGELEKMLEAHSFLIYEFLNRDQIQSRYFNGSEMTAFEHIDFAQAVLYNTNI